MPMGLIEYLVKKLSPMGIVFLLFNIPFILVTTLAYLKIPRMPQEELACLLAIGIVVDMMLIVGIMMCFSCGGWERGRCRE